MGYQPLDYIFKDTWYLLDQISVWIATINTSQFASRSRPEYCSIIECSIAEVDHLDISTDLNAYGPLTRRPTLRNIDPHCQVAPFLL